MGKDNPCGSELISKYVPKSLQQRVVDKWKYKKKRLKLETQIF